MKFVPAATLKSLVFALIRIALSIGLILLLILFFFQEHLIFAPSKLPKGYHFDFSHAFEEHWIDFGGEKIDSLVFKSESPKGVVLYFHGNAGDLSSWGEVAAEISTHSHMDVWIIDYPGYGKSEGRIESETQLHKLAETFWQEVTKSYPPGEKKIIFGRSIGTGLAVRLASEHDPVGLILESPYSNLTSVANRKIPHAGSLLKYTLHSDLWIRNVKCPILIFHGTLDEVIPFSEGEHLASLVPAAQFVPIKDGRHNDLADYDPYWPTLDDWLAARAQ